MRYHCNSCGRDFTTLSREIDKSAFSNLMLDDMKCPHCGARNRTKNLKPLKKTRNRWQPKRRSADTDDIYQPIVLSPICRKRLMVSFGDRIIMKVACDGCPSAFNCLTGNVDESVDIEIQEKANEVEKDEQVKKAKVDVEERIKKDKEEKIVNLIRELSNLGFGYELKNGLRYAKFKGTIWKLDADDEKAIIDETWQTEKTAVIMNTLKKRGIELSKAKEVLLASY